MGKKGNSEQSNGTAAPLLHPFCITTSNSLDHLLRPKKNGVMLSHYISFGVGRDRNQKPHINVTCTRGSKNLFQDNC